VYLEVLVFGVVANRMEFLGVRPQALTDAIFFSERVKMATYQKSEKRAMGV
jgi:hypothetical protein